MTLAGDSVKTGGQPGYHAGNSHLNHTNFAIGLPSFPDTVSAPTRHHDCIGMWPTANMCDSLKENRRFPEGYQTSMTNTRLKKLREWLSRWWHSPRIFKFFYLRSRLAGFYQALSRYQLLFWAGLVGVLGGPFLRSVPRCPRPHTGRHQRAYRENRRDHRRVACLAKAGHTDARRDDGRRGSHLWQPA